MLFKLLRAIRFLGKQGLAFRGHNESSEAFQGNLYQLLQAEDCPKMVAYISPKIDITQSMWHLIALLIRSVAPSGMLMRGQRCYR